MAEPTRRKKWSDVKARLEALDRKGLVSLLGDLYDANVANRRFLHSRLTPGNGAIEEYRRLVADASISPFRSIVCSLPMAELYLFCTWKSPRGWDCDPPVD